MIRLYHYCLIYSLNNDLNNYFGANFYDITSGNLAAIFINNVVYVTSYLGYDLFHILFVNVVNICILMNLNCLTWNALQFWIS